MAPHPHLGLVGPTYYFQHCVLPLAWLRPFITFDTLRPEVMTVPTKNPRVNVVLEKPPYDLVSSWARRALSPEIGLSALNEQRAWSRPIQASPIAGRRQ